MLMAACANEDTDARTVRYILERVKGGVNRRMKSSTWKWYVVFENVVSLSYSLNDSYYKIITQIPIPTGTS